MSPSKKTDISRKSMNPYSSPKDSKQLLLSTLSTLEEAVRVSNSLPDRDELELARLLDPDFERVSQKSSRHIISLIHAIRSGYKLNPNSSGDEAKSSSGESSSDSNVSCDDIYEHVKAATEESLEKFNAALDVTRGIKDAVYVSAGAIGPMEVNGKSDRIPDCLDIPKPQETFHDYPIDNSDAPFMSSYLKDTNSNDPGSAYLQNLFKTNAGGGAEGKGLKHPYEEEIMNAAAELATHSFKEENTLVYRDFDETPCHFVTTEKQLSDMAANLRTVNEIAVDIENHSVRSFQGFICLIQISTRREDYVVDTLALRKHIHCALAPVFADEEIVKVMHGADKDVQWLERDFGIYVVGMFDTGQAARALKYPSKGLSYLLAKFCSITNSEKQKFQLADWRQRPLPPDMFKYARSDTHYLLYVYDRMRVELIKNKLLAEVFEKSANVARKRHSKVRFNSQTPRQLAAKYGLCFDNHQMRVFEELYRWRDHKAREDDESLNYVLPMRTLFRIVRGRDKCRTVEGFLDTACIGKAVPVPVKEEAERLVVLIGDILDAKLES